MRRLGALPYGRATAPITGDQTRSRIVKCFQMSPTADLNDLRAHLRELDAEFDREMRSRGFDPAQAENVALPSHLAALYAEREKIRAHIEESEGKTND